MTEMFSRRGRTKFNALLGVATFLPVPVWLTFFVLVFAAAPENYEPPLLLGLGVVALIALPP